MGKRILICGLLLSLISMLLLTGGAWCRKDDTSAGDSSNKIFIPHDFEFNINNNGATVDVNQLNTILITLRSEGADGGYEWIETISSGLVVKIDTYQVDNPNVPGSGGTCIWLLSAEEKGTQTFSAIYKRSWEPTTGNEPVFNITFNVK